MIYVTGGEGSCHRSPSHNVLTTTTFNMCTFHSTYFDGGSNSVLNGPRVHRPPTEGIVLKILQKNPISRFSVFMQ